MQGLEPHWREQEGTLDHSTGRAQWLGGLAGLRGLSDCLSGSKCWPRAVAASREWIHAQPRRRGGAFRRDGILAVSGLGHV